MMPPIEFSKLKLGELQLQAKGAKHIPLFYNGEQQFKWHPGALQMLWQPKTFNDPTATRVSICFQTTPEVENYIRVLETWVLDQVKANPQMYLGHALTPDKVEAMFTSALKTSEKGYTHLRAKMNLEIGRAHV